MNEIKRGEIYYANLQPVLGSEQGGIRPVVILQNDKGNSFSHTTIVAAITARKGKTQLPTHVTIVVEGLSRKSIVLLEQIRTIDKERIIDFVGVIDGDTMKLIENAIVISLGIERLIVPSK